MQLSDTYTNTTCTTMATSSPPTSPEGSLATLMAGVAAEEDVGSSLQQAICGLVARDGLPVDAAFDSLATFAATKVGLTQSGGKATIAYAVSKVAILQTAEAVGVGAGLVSLDGSGFTLARIQAGIEDLQLKMNILVDTPHKLALDSFWNVLNLFKSNQLERMITEVNRMVDHSRQAFEYTKGKGPNEKNLKDCVAMQVLAMMAEYLLTAYDGHQILPFYLLTVEKKAAVGDMMERAVGKLEAFSKDIEKQAWLPESKSKKQRKQNMLDAALRVAYPFISEARNLTTTMADLDKTNTAH